MHIETIPGLDLIEHEIEVPLHHLDSGVRDADRLRPRVRRPGDRDDRDALLFLQGGPGGESPRPIDPPMAPEWLERALQDYRLILADQRGTGRSTPLTAMTGMSPQERADYLAHFRADSVVEDAELLRAHLGISRWSLLGQSFGGFCSLRYLSTHPQSLREVLFTGGVPPVGLPVDEVYAATFARTIEIRLRTAACSRPVRPAPSATGSA